jgi:hypothetical protein
MSDEKGFTVRDRRTVKSDGTLVETREEATAAKAEERPEPARPSAADDDGKRHSVDDQSKTETEQEQQRPLPPVDFTGFVFGLGQMALMHLGDIAEPQSGQISRNLDQARHVIDILDMLEEKTRGNLTQEEDDLLRTLKSELKLKFVKVSNMG